jgi:antirestriction protein ArdC
MTMTRTDIHATVTAATIARREAETRPRCKPWNAEHAAGRITRPLRHDGTPYRVNNVLVHWMTVEARVYAAPHRLSFKQAREIGR